MFRGEKTSLFWAGLIVLCVAALFLFQTIWSLRLAAYSSEGLSNYIVNMIPMFVGTIAFILVGWFMMKSGVKKDKPLPAS